MNWHLAIRTVAPTATALTLCGCDTVGGVLRHAYVDTAPDAACVRTAIEQTSDVVKVTPRYNESTSYYVFGVDHTVSNSFEFRGAQGSNILGVVQIDVRNAEAGKDEFSTSLLDINRTPPQQEIDASRPVMKAIEARLEASCGLAALATKIKESCSGGAKCPPLR